VLLLARLFVCICAQQGRDLWTSDVTGGNDSGLCSMAGLLRLASTERVSYSNTVDLSLIH